MTKLQTSDIIEISVAVSGSVVLALILSFLITVTIQGNTEYGPNEEKPGVFTSSTYWITFAITVSLFLVISMAIIGFRRHKRGGRQTTRRQLK
jgi:integral membrane sensor domain MASE1